MRAHVVSAVRTALKDENIWASFLKLVQNGGASDNLRSLKSSKKQVGDLWEAFCVEFLSLKGYDAARLEDVPAATLSKYKLASLDRGIDIIAHDNLGNPCAVQCKYRHRGCVSWRELSTFEALCVRSGPWHRHIVMTNGPGVRREGESQPHDQAFAREAFSGLKRHEWEQLAGYGKGKVLGGSNLSRDLIAEKRLKFLEKKVI